MLALPCIVRSPSKGISISLHNGGVPQPGSCASRPRLALLIERWTDVAAQPYGAAAGVGLPWPHRYLGAWHPQHFRDWAAETTAYPREAAEMAPAHTVGNQVEVAYRRGDLFDKQRSLMRDWALWAGVVVDGGPSPSRT
jgi:hypothetical protein